MKKRPAISITRFVDDYRFLSNFYRCNVTFEGSVYPSCEHAYQAAKTSDPRQRRRILNASTPAVAKRLGRRLSIRPNWNAIKQGAMLACLESKFSDPKLAARLLATHPSPLVEGNTWGDTYWGVDLRTGEGENILGKLLQIVRENLRKGHGRTIAETREKRAAVYRDWRVRRTAALKAANLEKFGGPPPPLPELPEWPWAYSKSKSREPLKRKEPGRPRSKK